MDCVQDESVEEHSIQDFCLFSFNDEKKWSRPKTRADKLTFDVEGLDENTFLGTQSIFFQTARCRS